MGFRVSIIACAAGDARRLLSAAGLTGTGEADAYNEAAFSGVESGNWYLLWQNWHDGMLDEADYARISRDVSLLACDLCETSMYAQTRYWSRGQALWSVMHNAQTGADHLEITGPVPKDVAELHDIAKAAQAADGGNVDHIFDVPVGLFERQTGFRHDAAHDLPFTGLQRVASVAKRPWWRVW